MLALALTLLAAAPAHHEVIAKFECQRCHLIEGIAEFAHRRDDWQFFLGPRGKYDRTTLPEGWIGDGVIARVTHQALADQILARRIPAVNVSWYSYGGERIGQGKDNARQYLKENPQAAKDLEDKLRAVLGANKSAMPQVEMEEA